MSTIRFTSCHLRRFGNFYLMILLSHTFMRKRRLILVKSY